MTPLDLRCGVHSVSVLERTPAGLECASNLFGQRLG